MTKKSSKVDSGSKDRPLSASELRNTVFKVPRHHYEPQKVKSRTLEATMLVATDETPTITSRLVPVGKAGRNQSWRVELEVSGAELSVFSPPPIKINEISRVVLAERKKEIFTPSMPAGADVLVKQPKSRRPQPSIIRFGDLRYEPTTIFSPDGRWGYYDTGYPWRCLVRITNPGGWSGSGVLIGPRHVLTASHCIDWTPGWLNVDVLYTNSSSLATTGAWLAYAASKVVGPGINYSESDEDYAVLVLNDRLGDQYGWLGCRTYNSSWDDETSYWCSVGYPQDFSGTGQVACFQTDFFLNELGLDYGPARLIRSQTFDNWPGQSGSPIFGFWSDGPYAVGVVSGQGTDYNYISGGSLLTSLVSMARTDHP